MCVQNTDQFVCAALSKPFKSNCSWRKATGNHLHICTSHVYDGASAMTMSSRTCLRAENSSSSSSSSSYIQYIDISHSHNAERKVATSIQHCSQFNCCACGDYPCVLDLKETVLC